MTEYEEDLFAAEDSAFAYAVRPFLVNYTTLQHFVPAPSFPSSPSTSAHSPCEPSFPVKPPHSTSPFCTPAPERGLSTSSIEAIASIRSAHIRTLLLRCKVIYATMNSLKHTSNTAKSADLRCHFADEIQTLAHKARQLAEGIRDTDLIAKAEFWATRVEAWTADAVENRASQEV